MFFPQLAPAFKAIWKKGYPNSQIRTANDDKGGGDRNDDDDDNDDPVKIPAH